MLLLPRPTVSLGPVEAIKRVSRSVRTLPDGSLPPHAPTPSALLPGSSPNCKASAIAAMLRVRGRREPLGWGATPCPSFHGSRAGVRGTAPRGSARESPYVGSGPHRPVKAHAWRGVGDRMGCRGGVLVGHMQGQRLPYRVLGAAGSLGRRAGAGALGAEAVPVASDCRPSGHFHLTGQAVPGLGVVLPGIARGRGRDDGQGCL